MIMGFEVEDSFKGLEKRDWLLRIMYECLVVQN